jgi:hypothetical protein
VVSDIPAGDGNVTNLFLQCSLLKALILVKKKLDAGKIAENTAVWNEEDWKILEWDRNHRGGNSTSEKTI